jgi:hypothetical protein
VGLGKGVEGEGDVDMSFVVGREESIGRGETSETLSVFGEDEMSETDCKLV